MFSAFAHGDNNLGPNKGYLKMPGAFHTELLSNRDGTFKIYLIDINFKNPMTKDSSVELKYIAHNKKIIFNCSAFNDQYFVCSSKEVTSKPKNGNIELKAIRGKVQASIATYTLPLKLENIEHDMDNM